jgi:predicted secreted protein
MCRGRLRTTIPRSKGGATVRRRRKRIALIVAAALALILVAAAVVWVFRAPLLELIPTPPVVVTEKDQGRRIDLVRGQRLEVRLPSNSNSGSTWRAGMPLPFLPPTGEVTFTGTPNAETPGDGYQSTLFVATEKGVGPLFLGYLPDNDQNSYTPTKSFSVIVSVQ